FNAADQGDAPAGFSGPEAPIAHSTGMVAKPRVPFREQLIIYYNEHLPLIVTLWLMGVLVLQLRFLGQLAYIQRLKNYGTQRFPPKWAAGIQQLETKLGIAKPVRYLTSFRVQSPFTVGWLNPVVLFPADLLDRLKESETYTILAHELAHIKRNDFVVNLIQTLLCSLFFYHPATWWMSARINEEREHCCDDLAIEATGEPVGYARTLLQMKEAEVASSGRLAMAFRGPSKSGFNYRIRRIVSGYLNGATYGEGLVTALILVAALATAVAASDGDQSEMAKEDDPLQQVDTFTADGDLDLDVDMEFENDRPTMKGRESGSRDKALAYEQWQAAVSAEASNATQRVLPDSLAFPFLLEAAEEGNYALVKYFLSRKINVNQEDENGWTPLMVAAGENHPRIVQLLLESGANVNYVNNFGWTALMEAADEGAYAVTEALLAAGADPELTRTSYTPTDIAAEEGHTNILELLVSKGAKLKNTSRGRSPLHLAAEEGQLSVVKSLIKTGVAIDAKDENGRTPLSYAAEEGKGDVIAYLLEQGAEVAMKDDRGREALSYAAEEGKATAIRILKANGASLKAIDRDGRTALHYAAEEGKTAVIPALVEEGVGPDVRTRNGHTPLHYAVSEDKLSTIRVLLALGADVNAKDNKGRRVLLYAAEDLLEEYHPYVANQWNTGSRRFNPDVIAVLLEAGATSGSINEAGEILLDLNGEEGAVMLSSENELIFQASQRQAQSGRHIDINEPNVPNTANPVNRPNAANKRNTADRRDPGSHWHSDGSPTSEELIDAVARGQNDRIDYLIGRGDNMNGIGKNGRTPLTEASFHNYNIHSHQLVKGGADINRTDGNGYTPLTMAVIHNHYSTVDHLLEMGADPDLKDDNGMTAKAIALRDNYPEILKLLNAAGASVTALGRDLVSPLRIPAKEGYLPTLRYLLEQGANPDDGSGCHPLFIASRERQTEAVKLLASYDADVNMGCDYYDTDFYGRTVPNGKGSIAFYQMGSPLMMAITQTHRPTVEALLSAGAEVDATCPKSRYTSKKIIYAREAENLSQYSCARNKRFTENYNVQNWTPLMEAVESGKPEIVQALLAAGADKSKVAGSGITALSLAKELKDRTIENLLK
ncbi:MAG: ankyrin repeat domain-containing protein, partial [Bacteroidota bacterium]